MTSVLSLLKNNADANYKLFSQKLIPDTKYPILGVRVPKIKEIAKIIIKDNDLVFNFLSQKHKYYEEWFLHGVLLGLLKIDFNELIVLIDEFIPHVDNWAICDSTVCALKAFKKHPTFVQQKTLEWINTTSPYTVRFAVVTLLSYFLTDNFSDNILKIVTNIKSDNYYVNMAIAWFLSVALIKQYEKTIIIIENKNLPVFIHNKSIQKAIESFRISNDRKEYLKTLRIKKGESNERRKEY